MFLLNLRPQGPSGKFCSAVALPPGSQVWTQFWKVSPELGLQWRGPLSFPQWAGAE